MDKDVRKKNTQSAGVAKVQSTESLQRLCNKVIHRIEAISPKNNVTKKKKIQKISSIENFTCENRR